MRVIFGLIFAVLVFFALRYKLRQWYRRLRGLPEPVEEGPKTTTIIVAALITIYAALLGYRLFIGGPIMH
ncbi:hypothetical protein HKX42_02025 [Salinisphaera sp. USBA-960]|uniref:hypothetical protein n=1 Tax=Salinisphaera orenii TaxID=856731 RepID=UPI0013A67D7A|nr:hypothetical protein [Salifodinibacter halophilus]NNC25653.1 hypothetical protein [Salifodinibacter halophilus]